MLREHLFDLQRVHLQSPDIDLQFQSAGDDEIPRCIEISEVAAVEESVHKGGRWIVNVLLKHGRRSDRHQALTAG